MDIEFTRPYYFEGETYNGLSIPIENFTGRQFAEVKRSWAKEGNFSAVPALDTEFCIRCAATLAKQPIEFFEGMHAGDYCKVAQAVSSFLLA